MTERDHGRDVPEFVAVPPRRVDPEPEAVVEDPAPDEVADTSEPAADSMPAASAEESSGPPEPAAGPDEPAADVRDPAERSAPATVTEPEPEPAATTTQPQPPAAAPERPRVPSLGARTPPTGPDAKLPETEPAAADDVEVSVRVAAEGMAAALGSRPAPSQPEEVEVRRGVPPLALATAVCVVLALAASALLAVTARSNSRHHAVAEARTAALEAAKRETAIALTYDYRTLEADFQRAEAGMSRKFRANYAATAATSVAPLAKKTHAITTGSVAAGGVVSATPTTVRILVFANQTVENKLLNATSRLDRSVIEVTMVKEDGRWVINDLQPF